MSICAKFQIPSISGSGYKVCCGWWWWWLWTDSRISISKVSVNFRQGEIRPKICHYRGILLFSLILYEKLFLIYFRGRYTTTSRREPSPQPFNNTVFVDLIDKHGETGVLVNCPGWGGGSRGRCLPQRQLKTVKTCLLFYFIYLFQGFLLNSDTSFASL